MNKIPIAKTFIPKGSITCKKDGHITVILSIGRRYVYATCKMLNYHYRKPVNTVDVMAIEKLRGEPNYDEAFSLYQDIRSYHMNNLLNKKGEN